MNSCNDCKFCVGNNGYSPQLQCKNIHFRRLQTDTVAGLPPRVECRTIKADICNYWQPRISILAKIKSLFT